MTHLLRFAALSAAAAAAAAPAAAQSFPLTFRAQYSFYDPGFPLPPNPNAQLLIGPLRTEFTLLADGTWSNDDGNGGNYEIVGTTITLYFIDQATSLALTEFGSAIWRGQIQGNKICNGQIIATNPPAPPYHTFEGNGVFATKGCP